MKATDGICQDVSVPVLIVGAGPAGATTALLLGRYGIPSIVISRHRGTANTPRAHIFNQRAMEVLRDAGTEGVVKDVASTREQIAHVTWLHTLSGEEYGRVYAWGTRSDRIGDYLVASPCEMSDLPQSVLEPILVEEAAKLGAEFRFSTEFLSQRQLLDGRVVTTVRNRATGAIYNITAQYLVGADGARSSVISSLGIPVDGEQLSNAFGVHIKADLGKYFLHRPGSMVWILNPDAPDWSSHGSIRMVRPWDEFLVSMHTAKDVDYDPCTEDVMRRLHQMIGDDSVQVELLNFSPWTINDQVARTWQKGNVFCIGDAVHRHPPFNGLGSNTCISDAFNLAWKLAYVVRGIAHPSILETLTLERKPVGDGIVRRANDGLLVHKKLWALMGSTTAERAVVSELLQAASIDGQRLRGELRGIIEETDDEFNALGIQMNQIYSPSSPLVLVEEGDRPPDLAGVNLLKEQVISTFPGFHVPHVWVVKDGQTERTSTLDLAGRGRFVLFTGIGGESWLQAAKDISRADGVPLQGYGIGRGLEYSDAYWDWEKVRGVEEDGAVLVRPDHFVCWRCQRLDSNPDAKLREVIQTLLRPAR
ncbi:hypothetical protein Z517_05211 [Fonsecaea pedrosoi CBS 271.37]|uniref:FAD-binding domain-containing protein n=1 Tax=Fonsecaea pedrosoi CBS 271.37 TaxID=1442368 RepID=A0A0D2HCA5_9EURO|nr:uncharacterized protein Z517_05211 [Fonsecaea pedrosoi CBS 271.37]KIW82184.1 hypothetical protein Z517_05211 [Fonsecaea pedrosoi CBS 271.37]